jgi:hypothetical protein
MMRLGELLLKQYEAWLAYLARSLVWCNFAGTRRYFISEADGMGRYPQHGETKESRLEWLAAGLIRALRRIQWIP